MPNDDDMRKHFHEITAEVNAEENPFIGLHVAFKQMREAGFTMFEACTILGVWIGNQAGGN